MRFPLPAAARSSYQSEADISAPPATSPITTKARAPRRLFRSTRHADYYFLRYARLLLWAIGWHAAREHQHAHSITHHMLDRRFDNCFTLHLKTPWPSSKMMRDNVIDDWPPRLLATSHHRVMPSPR